MSRIFTQEELDRMAAQTQDLAKEAIDAGNYQEAKDLIDKMYGELAFLHDGATAGLLACTPIFTTNTVPRPWKRPSVRPTRWR